MKTLKASRILTVAIAVLLAVSLLSLATASAADDHVINYVQGAVSDNTEGLNGFFGPYFGPKDNTVVLDAANGLVINMADDAAWVTSEIAPQEIGMYKYATFKIKTDDPSGIAGWTMTIGGKGQLWTDWITADGSKAPQLTKSWQEITMDLSKSGVTKLVDRNADFAMNKGEAKSGKIYLQSITFTDTKPAGGSQTTTAAGTTAAGTTAAGTTAGTTAADTTDNTDTGVADFAGIAALLAITAGSAIVLTSKKRK